jgi:hypothetical protein
MKDERGHGSDARGDMARQNPTVVSISAIRPSQENLAWIAKGLAAAVEGAKAAQAAYGGKLVPIETGVDMYRQQIRSGAYIAPLSVDTKMNLIDGHTRLLAYKAEGIAKVPVQVVRGK